VEDCITQVVAGHFPNFIGALCGRNMGPDSDLGSIIPTSVMSSRWLVSLVPHCAASGLCLQLPSSVSSFPERGPGWGPSGGPAGSKHLLRLRSNYHTRQRLVWEYLYSIPCAPSCPFVSLMRCAMLSTSTHFVGTGVAGCPPCGVSSLLDGWFYGVQAARLEWQRALRREEKRLAPTFCIHCLTLPYAHICLIISHFAHCITFCVLHVLDLFAYAAGNAQFTFSNGPHRPFIVRLLPF